MDSSSSDKPASSSNDSEEEDSHAVGEEDEDDAEDNSEDELGRSVAGVLNAIIPAGFEAVVETPASTQGLLCRSVVMKTKVKAGYRGTELLWYFGTLTRAFDPTN